MREKNTVPLLLRSGFFILLVLVCLTIVISPFSNVKPARAAAFATGDVTFTLDPGNDPSVKVTAAEIQQGINQLNSMSGSLSDKIKRMVEEYNPSLPSSLGASQYQGDAQWVDFDGTLSVTSDGTGVSLTIPASEAQAHTTAAWWQQILAATAGVLTWVLVRTTCSAALVLAIPALVPVVQVACASLASFLGSLIRSIVLMGFANQLNDPQQWAGAVIGAGLLAVGSGLWEAGLNFWALGTGIDGTLPAGTAGLPRLLRNIGTWIGDALSVVSVVTSTVDQQAVSIGNFVVSIANALPAAVAALTPPSTPSGQSCDVYAFYKTPCAGAYSTVHAMFSAYNGPLYQVQRASDNTTMDIGVLSPGGYANAAAQDTFCAGTTCTISKVYDQSSDFNDLTVEGAGGAAGADHAASATALPITANGHKAYGIEFTGGIGYRDNNTLNIASNGGPEGMYMVASGTNVNSGCCNDFGNAETNTRDNGNGHMDAVNFSTTCYFPPCTGSGPWVEADLENGLFQGGNGSNTANTGLVGDNFVTAMLKNDGQTTYALKGGNAQSGGLTTWYNGGLPTIGGYKPMQQEGAIVLGTGGDNSNWSVGSFFEGAMTAGYPSDNADNAVQSDIVATAYAGNSGGTGGAGGSSMNSPAGPAVVHSAGATGASASGYSSVYTVDATNGHLEETYLTAMGQPWVSQDLTANYGTPPVMTGTQPVAIVHSAGASSAYTSVYTVAASNGHLWETYLSAIGQKWIAQDLTANYGTPPVEDGTSPTAVVHSAGASSAYTSVYTVDASDGHLWETYLSAIGQKWIAQDLTANYGTPQVLAGTSPVSIVHSDYTSVYTVDTNHDLEETYLTAIGQKWVPQDLSANYKTPPTSVTPTALVHSGYTSVYTVDDGSSHLEETYLPAIGDAWTPQDLSANYNAPPVAPGTQPVALFHTGYSSVYTVDKGTDDVQETYLANIGAPWASQDFTTSYGTPPTDQTPIALLHPDANGNLSWTSVYTIGELDTHLEETYLPAIGDKWTWQDLTGKYQAPQVKEAETPTAISSVIHFGYSSIYSVDASNGHLQESYLTAMGKPWATQDLSANFGTPPVLPHVSPVAVVHRAGATGGVDSGYTSVYTIAASNGHLWETYLSAIGQKWISQDLSANFGTPPSKTTPAVVVHEGYTSVYTVDASDGHLWETYLTAIGNPWHSQDLTAAYNVPIVDAFSSPSAVEHSGWTSVYTIDASNEHLQETYLPAIGDKWTSQDLSAAYGTPAVDIESSPNAVFHDGFTSVYTLDANDDLEETYLPAIGDAWVPLDLSAKFGTPTVEPGMSPVALYHTGYISVYTLNKSNGDLEETFLAAIGDSWATHDLKTLDNTPVPNQPPSAMVHYDANGGVTWTSIYTVDASNNHLQETNLSGIGAAWTTQDLTANYNVPAV